MAISNASVVQLVSIQGGGSFSELGGRPIAQGTASYSRLRCNSIMFAPYLFAPCSDSTMGVWKYACRARGYNSSIVACHSRSEGDFFF